MRPATIETSACPNENAFARLLEGLASDSERAELERHVDRCPACAELLTMLGRAYAPSPTTSTWEASTAGEAPAALEWTPQARRSLTRIALFAALVHVVIGAKLGLLFSEHGVSSVADLAGHTVLIYGLVWGPFGAVVALAAATTLARSWRLGRKLAFWHAILSLPSIVLTPLSLCTLYELRRHERPRIP
jgi:anti-sigma factor RsiW